MSGSTAIAIRDGQQTFDDLQVKALAQLGVKDASKADLAIFFHQCARTGLDPFARQVYLIARKTKDESGGWVTRQTIQTGIDGFRLVARRAVDKRNETLGYADTLWCGEDGQWRDVWLSSTPPAAAKVVVYRNGQPFPGIALMAEYRQTNRSGEPTKMWHDKPVLMLAKCAEALALRMAFPQDLSGLYTTDETGDQEPGGVEDDPAVATGGVRRMSRRPLAAVVEVVEDAPADETPEVDTEPDVVDAETVEAEFDPVTGEQLPADYGGVS